MADGSRDVPLWRYKGVQVPLNLDKFHPYGCRAEAVIPQKAQTRFGPKTKACILLDYDFHALSFVLASLPAYKIMHSAHVIFHEAEFPCRETRSHSWDNIVSYDVETTDPLAAWLGPTRVARTLANPVTQEDHMPPSEEQVSWDPRGGVASIWAPYRQGTGKSAGPRA